MPKPTEITLQTLTGEAITPYLSALAALRIEVFRDWPYIYDGSLTYEEKYLQTYTQAERAAVVVAFAGDAVIGAATCLPLTAEPSHVQQPFVANGLDPQDYFYFGESVLRKAYRGRGIGVGFFEAREAQARRFKAYKMAAFCAVQRPNEHPLRPAGFVPLDAFWGKRGYTKQPQLQCRMSWTDRGDTEQSEKTLTFWTKNL
ncbi:MAG TPA: GNAT family N-acetyltransferase [Acidocella sp.]|nr:GNAT family N-acetyltransferase [Acidocella sp.]OYV50548.1 MAG: GNAT family N-acetyltransferase [Acidocella sp. 20-58-15]HQT39129.1 GNAT family N-acetyltransferase [Acidocella sp.]